MQLGRLKHIWENIKINLRETGWVADWIHLAQDSNQWWTHVNMVINIQIPHNSGNLMSG